MYKRSVVFTISIFVEVFQKTQIMRLIRLKIVTSKRRKSYFCCIKLYKTKPNKRYFRIEIFNLMIWFSFIAKFRSVTKLLNSHTIL